jgi:hypothetical protein
MAKYQDDQGAVLDIPGSGGHALLALGWTALDGPEPEQDAEIPGGDPTEKWSAGEIKAYAEREGIDLDGTKNKGEYLTAISATLELKKQDQ